MRVDNNKTLFYSFRGKITPIGHGKLISLQEFDISIFLVLMFRKKIKPYKKILDEQLWEDLNQYFMAPDQPLESTILPPRIKIVQKLPTRSTELPLLPLNIGNIIGFKPQTFWNTVVIMKVKETEETLGGYTPLIWDANSTTTNPRSWRKTSFSH
ncbi:hypothetical protein Glove_199g16 [Diversispora epigaea]|uniref:Uncharacterized protein n=1 Tax=Diversispora epigaea TaxID=1348612 RepID=A0A397IJQ3_9GLOM|nr:hypothetical protein Glove_199g16 [Diversispora epigaea]